MYRVMQMMGMNPTKKEAQSAMEQVDKDGNMTMEFPEFVEMMKQNPPSESEAKQLKLLADFK